MMDSDEAPFASAFAAMLLRQRCRCGAAAIYVLLPHICVAACAPRDFALRAMPLRHAAALPLRRCPSDSAATAPDCCCHAAGAVLPMPPLLA